MNITTILVVAGVLFVAELPDKSMFASLVLSTKFRKRYVWMGAAAAFLVHVIIAVSAGQALTLLPKRLVEGVVAALFALGAGLLLFGKDEDEEDLQKNKDLKATSSFKKAFTTSFVVIFLGEWGDITQIATANYAAKYHDILSVAVGAILGLWSVAAFGIVVGSKILDKIPAKLVQRFTGIILLIFAIISAISALKH